MADGRHAARGLAALEARLVVALLQRDREQAAVRPERPGVIGAAEELARVAAAVDGDLRALVRAAVEQHAHAVVGVAHHDHRLRTDRRGEVVADILHLAVVAHVVPGVVEEVLHLQVEDLLVDVHVAMHFRFPHQRLHGLRVSGVSGHGHLLLV